MLIDRSHRSWIIACLVVLAAATAIYVPYVRHALNGPSGGSAVGLTFGVVGSALMLFAGALGARRKVPTWQIGRGTFWMRGHIWLGLLSFPLILFHGGFRLGGPLTAVLMILFGIVIVSGILGLLLQQVMPRLMLTRVPTASSGPPLATVSVYVSTCPGLTVVCWSSSVRSDRP